MKSLKFVLIVGLLPLALGACDALKMDSRKFDGDPKLEFAPTTETVNEGAGTVTTEIQLIGKQRDSDLSVNFTVADSSTAVEGTHFSLSSTSATIPANSSQTEVQVQVLDNSTNDGDTNYVLFLNLQDSQGVEAAENLKTFTLTIRGTDE
ncbi:MAG: Calx-beta domain-containing protein [Salinibacter sp.]